MSGRRPNALVPSALTIGSDIYFAPGRYQPDTVQRQQLLGHELAHVVQQRAAAHRVAVQAKMMPGAVQPSSPVRISAPINAGPSSYRLTAGTGGRQVGSVMVHARDQGAVEVTDLSVAEAQRGHGIGQMLVVTAAKTGLQSGKSKVTLAAQDNGSGRLTQWYKSMGFTQVGVNQHGFPRLEAPISRILVGSAHRRETLCVGPDQVVSNPAIQRRNDTVFLPRSPTLKPMAKRGQRRLHGGLVECRK